MTLSCAAVVISRARTPDGADLIDAIRSKAGHVPDGGGGTEDLQCVSAAASSRARV